VGKGGYLLFVYIQRARKGGGTANKKRGLDSSIGVRPEKRREANKRILVRLFAIIRAKAKVRKSRSQFPQVSNGGAVEFKRIKKNPAEKATTQNTSVCTTIGGRKSVEMRKEFRGGCLACCGGSAGRMLGTSYTNESRRQEWG